MKKKFLCFGSVSIALTAVIILVLKTILSTNHLYLAVAIKRPFFFSNAWLLVLLSVSIFVLSWMFLNSSMLKLVIDLLGNYSRRRKRSFFRPAAQKMLAINKLFLRFFTCGTKKILVYPLAASFRGGLINTAIKIISGAVFFICCGLLFFAVGFDAYDRQIEYAKIPETEETVTIVMGGFSRFPRCFVQENAFILREINGKLESDVESSGRDYFWNDKKLLVCHSGGAMDSVRFLSFDFSQDSFNERGDY